MASDRPSAPILIVDDDAATRELIATHLGREGFETREAPSGEAALRLIETEVVSLVILDMRMPGLSGAEVVGALRERLETATLPIIVLTGKGKDYPLAASLGVGADDYLTKPIRLDELAARVRAQLRSQRVAAEQARRESEKFYREREAVSSALARMDPAGTAEEIAAAACAVIAGVPGVDSTIAISLDGVDGSVLAVTGRLTAVFAQGMPVAPARVAYLREHATPGLWLEESWSSLHTGVWSEAITAAGLLATAYAPLRSPHGVIGIVGIGSHDPATAPALVEHMPTLAAFASVLGALLVPRLEARRTDAEERSSIQAVLDASTYTPFFQPIVDLRSGAVVGYEALTRFTDGVPPDRQFAAAARAGLGIELELATLAAAIEAAGTVLSPTVYLSLNASPDLIASGVLGALLRDITRPLVLEVTEHLAITDYVALREELAALGSTVRLAVDDAGAGYASFRHILELAPAIVKLDIGLIRGLDADPARQALLGGMAQFARKRGIRLVAEGIETGEVLEVLRSLGIPHGQGYLLGRPQLGKGPGPWPDAVALGTSPDKDARPPRQRACPTRRRPDHLAAPTVS